MIKGERVKNLIDYNGLTQAGLARAAGISNDYMNKIVNGKVTNVGLDIVASLAKALGVRPTELIDDEEPDSAMNIKPLNSPQPKQQVKAKLIPVLGHAACGKWEDFTDLEYPVGHADEWWPAPSRDPNAFFVRARGDSMVGGDIETGDLLLVEPNAGINNGCKVLAKDPENGCTVKLYFNEGGRIRLQPMNPKYSPLFIEDGENVRVYRITGRFSKL